MPLPIQTIRLPETCDRIALCGGPYSNFAAVEAFLAATKGIEYRFCLGDIGGFGPHPNRTIDLLRQANVICLQGNYDHAVGAGEPECGCGYVDSRDREFAQISYDYTLAHTAEHHRQWMQTLPSLIRLEWREQAVLLCHGSPRQVNEFVWQSETDDARIRADLAEFDVVGICGTHSGLPWLRTVSDAGFWCNVGVLGRPAHDGTAAVWYGILSFSPEAERPTPELMRLSYDVAAVVEAMQQEGLPREFWQSLEEGIWTTCSTVLPEAEQQVQPRVEVSPSK